MKKVGVLMGSDSDLPVVRKALDTLRAFGVPYEVHVYSAHRTPAQAQAFCSSARDQGFGVLIAPPVWPPTWQGLRRPTPPCR